MTAPASIPLEASHPSSPSQRQRLQHALEHAEHLLPAQPPIRFFVHHNTLHAFQHLPFDEAVVQAAACFGTEPYESEAAFAKHVQAWRITAADIDAVLATEALSDAPVFAGGPTQAQLVALRLAHPLPNVEGAALEWLLEDGDALDRFHSSVDARARADVMKSAARHAGRSLGEGEALRALYELLAPHAPRRARVKAGPRPRDAWLKTTGRDVDAWTQPLMIRFCASFIDQGIAYWELPGRQRGLLGAFAHIYRPALHPPDPWWAGLARRLRALPDAAIDPWQVAIDSLIELSVPEANWDAVVTATLRALPGWAGMVAQLQARPDRAPIRPPPARLIEYLALYLLLETEAVSYLRIIAQSGEDDAQPSYRSSADDGAQRDDAIVYDALLLAQHAGIGPFELQHEGAAAALIGVLQSFDSVARRRLWHLAYERHHRHGILDAMLAHARAGVPPRPDPDIQALFCIDEREESLRRHVEELDRGVETFGFAGFYGVPMAYQGIEDVRPTPLCPVTMRPTHLVREIPIASDGPMKDGRRWAVALRHATHVGSQTAVRGGVLSATLGLASVVPLIGRCLFPRTAERIGHALHHSAVPGAGTRLKIARGDDESAGPDGLLPGFTAPEMAAVVFNVLSTCGLRDRLAPLVAVVGHGSSSLNNPHESAHDCGATGGGRGGPNARAFAAMANDPGCRAVLAERGMPLGESYFIGGYHNTCDDSITWYDADLIPAQQQVTFERLQLTMDRARTLDAHERCRRFESAPLSLSPAHALAHVEGRAVDLGEPRPEYGHATNAICVVGRRERTRGLFMDRRAFLVSYDPSGDADGSVLGPLLASVGPVGAGINLEYYFSFVDPFGYGCGTKLPHNITGLLGVMDGHASDLRTGLPWQMVEIHEPVRLLTIVEAEPALLAALLQDSSGLRELVVNRWIQLVAWSPSTGQMSFYSPRGFEPHGGSGLPLPSARTSTDYYRGQRGHLACARIEAALHPEAM